jgi:hypothetical protein
MLTVSYFEPLSNQTRALDVDHALTLPHSRLAEASERQRKQPELCNRRRRGHRLFELGQWPPRFERIGIEPP